MIQQIEITLKSKSRGFHLVTSEILSQLPKLPKTGIMNIFCKHTSCGLSINENADPDVRVDMETIFNRLVPENSPEYEHTLEGADDMPAHAKSTLSGVSLTIPITDGRLNMGTWQGNFGRPVYCNGEQVLQKERNPLIFSRFLKFLRRERYLSRKERLPIFVRLTH